MCARAFNGSSDEPRHGQPRLEICYKGQGKRIAEEEHDEHLTQKLPTGFLATIRSLHTNLLPTNARTRTRICAVSLLFVFCFTLQDVQRKFGAECAKKMCSDKGCRQSTSERNPLQSLRLFISVFSGQDPPHPAPTSVSPPSPFLHSLLHQDSNRSSFVSFCASGLLLRRKRHW